MYIQFRKARPFLHPVVVVNMILQERHLQLLQLRVT